MKGTMAMVTDYPQVLVEARPRTRPVVGVTVRRALRRIGQALCGLRGHDLMRHYERDRFALECTSCGHVSAGWQVSGPGPQLRYAGDPRRHQLEPTARVKTARSIRRAA
jgi:hypothetical protein